MAHILKRLVPLILALAMIIGATSTAARATDQMRPLMGEQEAPMHTSVMIEKYGDNPQIVTYHQYGTITSKAGTVLVTCEARIDEYDTGNPSYVYLWRSTDGGRSFGEHIVVADCTKDKCSPNENECGKGVTGHLYSNPTFVIDYRTGRIFIFYCEIIGNPQEYTRVFYTYSDDDGLTWVDGIEITDVFANDPLARPLHVTGPGHGLQISSGPHAGRLILNVWHSNPAGKTNSEKKYGPSFLYSDDGGATWQVSEYVDIETNHHIDETRVAELAGGTLVLNGRAKDETRKQAYSVDGGVTWSTPTTWTSIGSYQNCDSGFASQVDEDGTILVTTHMKTGTYVRNTLYAYVSFDNGVTWSEGGELWSDLSLQWGGTGASDVNVISKDTFGCVHGTKWKNNDLVYEVFNVAYAGGTNDESPAAQIGMTNYDTLAAAVAAAKTGDTIIMRADQPTAQNVIFDKEIFIDLDGYDLWTKDLKDLCADGYAATYDTATGQWHIVAVADSGCVTHLINEDFANGLPEGWVATESEDVTWSYADGKVTADLVRDDSRSTTYLTSPAVLDGLACFTVSFDVTFYKLGSQGWSALYYRLTNDEGKPLSILMEMRDGGDMAISCQRHDTAVTNAISSSFSQPQVTITDNAATARVRFEGVVDAARRLTLTLYVGNTRVGEAVYDISVAHLRSVLFLGTPVNTGVYANHRIAFDNVAVSVTNEEHTYAGDCDDICEECDHDRASVGEHTYTDDYDPTCNVCGFEREAAPAKNGWVQEGGQWAYYKNGAKVTSEWMEDSVGWVYIGEDGYMLTNEWARDSVGWCYVGDDGYCVTSVWKQDSVGWCYLDANGRMATSAWIKDSVGWCYVGDDGYCVTNTWKRDSVGWCYLNAEGRMAVNAWVQDSIGWCYVGADGYAVTNCWKRDSVGWCYLNSEGSMVKNDWVQDGGQWYFLDANGYMLASTSCIWNGKTYHFNASGVCTNP